MNNTGADHTYAPSVEANSSPARPEMHVASAEELALISFGAKLLFENGQSTERIVSALDQLADALGLRVAVFPRWGDLIIRIDDGSGSRHGIVAAAPVGVEMRKVAATSGVIDEICSGHLDVDAARSALEAVVRFPPVSIARFALLAAAGAAALGVIFGAAHPFSLLLIAISAGAGACLRRWLSGISRSPFIQPLCAALLAGVIGSIAVRLQLSSALRLIAVCPCMILVPGPHLLNGTIDLARARIALGASRIAYAGVIILMICTGLLTGLSFGSVSLPASAPSYPVPLGYDVLAAGVAVAAYGTFFAMPWRMLPIPIAIGMLAHASRWAMISLAGASVQTGALVACLIVGIVITPIADRLRLPFAAFAFVSVVSLIPGVYLFRMAAGLVDLVTLGDKASVDMLLNTIADGTTAMLVIQAMAIGLILPKMCIEYFYPGLAVETHGKTTVFQNR
ncbi:MAG: hypothetical protein QOJ17_6093 [Rhodospirillaceae bacterium]|nr:hypothetical protein [Rhodospirillaceae bacterium]